MAKPIKNELRTARTAKISHARGHAKREDCTVIEEGVSLNQWAWLQHVLKMSSFKKREKVLRRTHRERGQVGYGGTDEP